MGSLPTGRRSFFHEISWFFFHRIFSAIFSRFTHAIHSIFAKVGLILRNWDLGFDLTMLSARDQQPPNGSNELNKERLKYVEQRKNTAETRITSSLGDADESTAKRKHVDFRSGDSTL